MLRLCASGTDRLIPSKGPAALGYAQQDIKPSSDTCQVPPALPAALSPSFLAEGWCLPAQRCHATFPQQHSIQACSLQALGRLPLLGTSDTPSGKCCLSPAAVYRKSTESSSGRLSWALPIDVCMTVAWPHRSQLCLQTASQPLAQL
jgi:hypothetical protein